MKISVIVSTFPIKRFPDLVDICNAMKKQSYDNFELLFIIDENKEFVSKVEAYIQEQKLDFARVIFNENNYGLSYSRNFGIKSSLGEICAFLDDDAIPSENWLSEMVETFNENTSIGAVTGDVLPLWEDEESMKWFPKELYWMISCSYILTPLTKQEVERGFGVNMAFKKDVLDKVGFFDENLGIKPGKWIGGEDTEMFLRVKDHHYKVMFNPEIKVLHKVPKDRLFLKNILKRAYNGGVSVAKMRKRSKIKIKKSAERHYLKKILCEFYPQVLLNIFKIGLFITIRKIVVVTLVSIFEFLGYIWRR